MADVHSIGSPGAASTATGPRRLSTAGAATERQHPGATAPGLDGFYTEIGAAAQYPFDARWSVRSVYAAGRMASLYAILAVTFTGKRRAELGAPAA